MSLQDDYFDLSEFLEGSKLKAFERIWKWGCEIEEENLKLSRIADNVKHLIDDLQRGVEQ